MKKLYKYYSLEKDAGKASIVIFGDIVSYPWIESDVSSYGIIRELNALDVGEIDVYVNSYGGEVAEGFAIYNALKAHKAKITTYCSGCACSAASTVFMAGDERIMYPASWLMIHNPWTYAAGNSEQLRKTADELETLAGLMESTYKGELDISDDALRELLDAESIITPEQALQWGFATAIYKETPAMKASASARKVIFDRLVKGVPGAAVKIKEPDANILHAMADIVGRKGCAGDDPGVDTIHLHADPPGDNGMQGWDGELAEKQNEKIDPQEPQQKELWIFNF